MFINRGNTTFMSTHALPRNHIDVFVLHATLCGNKAHSFNICRNKTNTDISTCAIILKYGRIKRPTQILSLTHSRIRCKYAKINA